MDNVSQSSSARPVSWVRQTIIYAIVLIIGLGIGFVPMWIRARASDNLLSAAMSRAGVVRAETMRVSDAAARQLLLATMQNSLATATIDADRGDYETARQAASSFFTTLREEATKGIDSSLSQAQKAGVESVLAGRDEIISLLARNDPAASQQLSDLYVSFRELLSK